MRRVCALALLLAAYPCAAQSPFTIGRFLAPVLHGHPLRIADGRASLESTVTICLVTNPNRLIVDAAAMVTNLMFFRAGVKLQWHEAPVCQAGPTQPVVLTLVTHTPEAYFPGALGVALPLEGSHAWVFYDRVQRPSLDTRQMVALLAHVMAHEIAHVLQGVIRHSESGILKAQWSGTDCARMVLFPLTFTRADAVLIRRGIEERRSPLSSSGSEELPADRSEQTRFRGERSPLP